LRGMPALPEATTFEAFSPKGAARRKDSVG
jgi:hypothetical protein